MNKILVIAWRDITRIRKQFGSGASLFVALGLLIVLGVSAFTFWNTLSLGSGLYQIGVSGEVPPIRDSRFVVIHVDVEQGKTLLDQHRIDVLIHGSQVLSRQDSKSQYAIRALKQYMEKEELERVGKTYPESDAFPLRARLNYLGAAQTSGQTNGGNITPQGTRPEETIIPSLTPPPLPFQQVIVALIYILPITFISIFFTSSFMDEKINRRLTILLSAPVTPLQIILGKMLPYVIFTLAAIAFIAVQTKGNVLLTLAIFLPTTLFIFAIYLMVPLFYRTFKDVTFIAMLVTTLTTAYLVFPAMFTGVTDLSFISPLTLAVKMYRGEPFGWREYLFPSLPMAAIFGFATYAGTHLLNEEFLIGYKPISRKIGDAIYLLMSHTKLYLSVPLWSVLVIPIVYMAQIIILAFAADLPLGMTLGVTLFVSAFVEEIVKSVGIVMLMDHGKIKSDRKVIWYAFLSALGFFIGEKLLVLISLTVVLQASISSVLFGTGLLLFVPLIAHFIFTALVTLLRMKTKLSYAAALTIGAMVHFLYNWYLLGGLQ
ncbi:MAG TPA: ABC transporter permease [Anaerolineales bacterium]|nr:ABC transporter permease [Anaerolineales bacterium]